MSEEQTKNQPNEGQAQDKKPATEISIDENRLMAALSYFGILFLIPLLVGNKKDPYVNFHLRQGIVLFIVDVVASIIAFIPIIGSLIALGLIIISIYAFVQALSGKKWVLPYIGQYAEKINV
ncbi:MAG: hypothetical protein V1738_06130 [Patescibacteria group bacterium]